MDTFAGKSAVGHAAPRRASLRILVVALIAAFILAGSYTPLAQAQTTDPATTQTETPLPSQQEPEIPEIALDCGGGGGGYPCLSINYEEACDFATQCNYDPSSPTGFSIDWVNYYCDAYDGSIVCDEKTARTRIPCDP